MKYDIIGDIHGCYDTLASLLDKLGYKPTDGCYQHDSRKVIFVGDFVDRGPKQLEVIECAKAMVDAGHALAVMGNHELNAIAYATTDPKDGGYLRRHSEHNQRNHQAFLDAFEAHPEKYAEVIDWFYQLPMWLEFDDLRIIHACWDQEAITRIKAEYGDSPYLSSQLAAIQPPDPQGPGQVRTVDISDLDLAVAVEVAGPDRGEPTVRLPDEGGGGVETVGSVQRQARAPREIAFDHHRQHGPVRSLDEPGAEVFEDPGLGQADQAGLATRELKSQRAPFHRVAKHTMGVSRGRLGEFGADNLLRLRDRRAGKTEDQCQDCPHRHAPFGFGGRISGGAFTRPTRPREIRSVFPASSRRARQACRSP